MAEETDFGSLSGDFPKELTHYLLIVVGEPLSEDFIEPALAEIEKGLKRWDIDAAATEFSEVLQGAASADVKKAGLVHRGFSHCGSQVGVVVLINPHTSTLMTELRSLLLHPAAYKHLAYGGHALEGCGDWVSHNDTYTLQQHEGGDADDVAVDDDQVQRIDTGCDWVFHNDSFTLQDVADIFSDPEVDQALLQAQGDGQDKQTFSVSGCHWNTPAITKQAFAKTLNLAINPSEVKNEIDGISELISTIKDNIVIPSPFELLEPPTMGVGVKCKITKPTVLIFPAAKGDCAFFAVSDFSIFVGGGYSVKSCFWKFAKHLHRIDAILMPHLTPDAVIGINSLLKRKICEKSLEEPKRDTPEYEEWQVKCNSPEVGVVYLNAPANKTSPKSLALKTLSQGNEMQHLLHDLDIKPFPCVANMGKVIDPITLYQKVGIGRLDMYILTPVQDSKELKDFLLQWSNAKPFGKVKTGIKLNGKEADLSLPNAVSICSLIVWQPANPNEDIVRVLFPGNAPQNKIMEGLDRIKHLDFLRQRDVTRTNLSPTKGPGKKGTKCSPKSAGSAKSKLNGPQNGSTATNSEPIACNDGVHCNTPPPDVTVGTSGYNNDMEQPAASGISSTDKNGNSFRPIPSGTCDVGLACYSPTPSVLSASECGSEPEITCSAIVPSYSPSSSRSSSPGGWNDCHYRFRSPPPSQNAFRTGGPCGWTTPPPEEEGGCTDFNTPPEEEASNDISPVDNQPHATIGESGLPESQQPPAMNRTAMIKSVGDVGGRDRLTSGEITPADQVGIDRFEQNQTSDAFGGACGGGDAVLDEPTNLNEAVQQPAFQEDRHMTTNRDSSPVIVGEASPAEVEVASPPNGQTHPWDPQIKLSDSLPVDDEQLLPEAEMQPPPEKIRRMEEEDIGNGDEVLVVAQGSPQKVPPSQPESQVFDAAEEEEEDTSEASQASQIEIKPLSPEPEPIKEEEPDQQVPEAEMVEEEETDQDVSEEPEAEQPEEEPSPAAESAAEEVVPTETEEQEQVPSADLEEKPASPGPKEETEELEKGPEPAAEPEKVTQPEEKEPEQIPSPVQEPEDVQLPTPPPSPEPEEEEKAPSPEPEEEQTPTPEPEEKAHSPEPIEEKALSPEPEKEQELQQEASEDLLEPEQLITPETVEPEQAQIPQSEEPEPPTAEEKVVTQEPEEEESQEPEQVASPEEPEQDEIAEPEELEKAASLELEEPIQAVSVKPEEGINPVLESPEHILSPEKEEVTEPMQEEETFASPEPEEQDVSVEPEELEKAASPEPEEQVPSTDVDQEPITSPEQEEPVKVASPEPEEQEEVASREEAELEEPEEHVASPEPEEPEKVTSPEPEEAEKVVSPEPEEPEQVASPEPEEPEKVASPEQVESPEPEEPEQVASLEPEQEPSIEKESERVLSPEPEVAALEEPEQVTNPEPEEPVVSPEPQSEEPESEPISEPLSEKFLEQTAEVEPSERIEEPDVSLEEAVTEESAPEVESAPVVPEEPVAAEAEAVVEAAPAEETAPEPKKAPESAVSLPAAAPVKLKAKVAKSPPRSPGKEPAKAKKGKEAKDDKPKAKTTKTSAKASEAKTAKTSTSKTSTTAAKKTTGKKTEVKTRKSRIDKSTTEKKTVSEKKTVIEKKERKPLIDRKSATEKKTEKKTAKTLEVKATKASTERKAPLPKHKTATSDKVTKKPTKTTAGKTETQRPTSTAMSTGTTRTTDMTKKTSERTTKTSSSRPYSSKKSEW